MTATAGAGYTGTGAWWPAPSADGPVDATIDVPGSKSLTNRYFLLAALATEPSVISGALDSRDTSLMLGAISALGGRVEHVGHELHIQPITAGPLPGAARVDCGLAGTVMRFVPPAAGLCTGEITFDGDPQARQRPLQPMLSALGELGVRLRSADGTPTSLPFTVCGTGRIAGGPLQLDASASSQFVSGLLLCGARMDHGLELRHTGAALPSPEHINMSVQVLRESGVEVDDTAPFRWRVSPGPISGQHVHVEPDLSNAGPFLAAALVTGGTVRIRHWPQTSTQIGARWPRLLDQLGGRVSHDGDTLTVRGTGRIAGGHFADTGELAPTVAALCALADSPSTLTGIGHLRGHETDRLAALAAEITALGGVVEERDDGLRITPRPLTGGRFHSYHDHRIATAAAVLGLAVPGIEVENIATTSKTLPGFPATWAHLLDAGSR